jgi:hypothetical protein
MKKYIWTSAAGNVDRSVTYHDKVGNSMTRYLDPKEVVEYRKNLRLISKFDMERKIRFFVGEEFEKLLDAIQRCEGWFSGDETITPVEGKEKVVGVKYLKQRIVAFLVETKNGAKRWLTHPEAVALAKAHKLLAVVVRTAHGVYLRSFPNQPNFSDMEIR